MNVELIEMPVEEAREKLAECRKFLKKRVDEQIAAAAKGYEAHLRGKSLIDLNTVFRNVPVDDKQRPKLAVARADRYQVRYFRRTWWDSHTFTSFNKHQNITASTERSPKFHLRFNAHPDSTIKNIAVGYALVPHVPADVRNTLSTKTSLSHYYILWEVEQWADRRMGAVPDRDPLLLEHLFATLYVVRAAWDLTDLERAIMAM